MCSSSAASAPCEYLCGSFFFLTRFAAYLLQRRLLFVLGQVYSVFIADRLTVCLLRNVLSVLNNGFRFSLFFNGVVYSAFIQTVFNANRFSVSVFSMCNADRIIACDKRTDLYCVYCG